MRLAMLTIRGINPSDAVQWLTMRRVLWPGDDEAHASEVAAFFAGTLAEPQHVLFAQAGQTPVGFAELSIREDIPGFAGRQVGYVEGLYVVPRYRAMGITRRLLRASSAWARGKSCVAFASDRADRIIIDRRFLTRDF
jgi:aminoglycoside 6'-N-acetyltransferase I